AEQHTEEELSPVGMEWERDRVLLPFVRALYSLRLHRGEREVRCVAVLTHPQAHEVADVLAAQEPSPLDRRAGKIQRDRPAIRAVRSLTGDEALQFLEPVEDDVDLLGGNRSRLRARRWAH